MPDVVAVNEKANFHTAVSTELSWTGRLLMASEPVSYLHLSAFRCEKCSGPVIAGWLGTRKNEISEETGITEIGAVCLACGRRPERMIEPSIGHHFRPVEWPWMIKKQLQPPDAGEPSLAAELSRNADTGEMIVQSISG